MTVDDPAARMRFASPADAHRYGEYRARAGQPGRGRFRGRVGLDGEHPVEAGRYHLYAGWACPWSHRATIQLALGGLPDAVSVSYVSGRRDARGWAFRPDTGGDPVNGFTLLQDAYDATEPGHRSEATVPVLWDRLAGRIVSNDPDTIDRDLAVAFRGAGGIDTYPAHLAARIDEAGTWIDVTITRTVTPAVRDAAARETLLAGFRRLDRQLARSRFLLGDALTLADVRLWVTLVRYDVGPNAYGAVGPRLASFPQLWDYARAIHSLPAVRATTDFAAFAAPLAPVPDWDAPSMRLPALSTSSPAVSGPARAG